MIIFNSNLFELIFIILYFAILYLFEKIINNKNEYIYIKISKSTVMITFFIIIIIYILLK